ncbi:hypothetical protein HDU96_000143 [Phlyctochytrium bullatum]|nr:hypothetical protein HDU96_000143 [Phlyctochytrium bullatum]
MLVSPVVNNVVVVVGGGLAGLSAAIEAYRGGAQVTLLEKEARLGGNSAKATSGMNAALSHHQKDSGVLDNIDLFRNDTLKWETAALELTSIRSGKSLCDPKLVETLTTESLDALKWIESFGLSLNAVSQCGGHASARTHREAPRADGKPAPVGWDIIRTLQDFVNSTGSKADGIKVITNASVQELLGDANGVYGVRYASGSDCFELNAKAVILATGGFAHDRTQTSLLQRHAPELAAMPTTNGQWATGDGVKMGLTLGAYSLIPKQVQVHPTGFVDPKDPENTVKFLAPESLRAYGGILIDPTTSRRFTNELGTRDVVSNAMMSLHRPYFYLILNGKMVESFDTAAIKFYMFKGLIQKFTDLQATAEACGLDLAAFKFELSAFNAAVASGSDSFGRQVFPNTFEEGSEFYVARVIPVIHYTMGGLKINEKAEIQRELEGGRTASIPGLYGAGEVTGGVHGGNRLAGNSLLECVVFGRIAGQQAASV